MGNEADMMRQCRRCSVVELYRGIIPRCHSAGAIQGIDFLEASRAMISMSTKPDDSGDSIP
jgi:hypothetical protein